MILISNLIRNGAVTLMEWPNGISFEHIPSSIDTLSLVISDSELENKLKNVVGEIQSECRPDSVEVYPNMALIATVGRGMAYTPGIASSQH